MSEMCSRATGNIGEKNGRAKLCDDQRREAYAMFTGGCSQNRIARHFGVTQSAVSKIIKQFRNGTYESLEGNGT